MKKRSQISSLKKCFFRELLRYRTRSIGGNLTLHFAKNVFFLFEAQTCAKIVLRMKNDGSETQNKFSKNDLRNCYRKIQ